MSDDEDIDQDAMAAEWAAAAGGDDEDVDQDAMAAEWEAAAGGDDDDFGDEWDTAGGDADDFGQSSRVLDQDEIDSLLGFDAAGDGDEDNSGVRAIINSGMVSYERLPMLEVVFDRFVRMLSTSMRNFTSDNVEVSLDNITSIRFGDYLNSIPLPAMLSVFKAVEWDNYGLITIDSALIYSIVDVLLGGRRGTAPMRIEGRPYTTIERSLIEKMIGIVLTDLSSSFDPLSSVTFQFDRLEVNPRFATIARPANAAILVKFRIDMEDRGGRLELLLPYATLEPVRELLLQMFMGEKFGRDSIWEGHLATELWNTSVDVQAVLDELVMMLSEVQNLKVGQTVLLNAHQESDVALRCGNIQLTAGRMGRIGDNIAVRVNRKLKASVIRSS